MSDAKESEGHILIIDDDESILEACELLFEDRGFMVTTRNSPANIGQDLTELHPDCLLMDISMPPYNGCDTCAEVKKANHNLPVILFSAGCVSDLALNTCGADAFISKPFNIKKIMETVQRLLISGFIEAF